MPADAEGPVPSSSIESTAILVARIRAGDAAAREILFARHLPQLRRIAHGRVPRCMRGQMDTEDLAQAALERALRHLHRFEHRRDGAFLAYLRSIVINLARDAARRAAHRPAADSLPSDVPCHHPTPLEVELGAEVIDAYEAALGELPPRRRRAVVLRVEFGLGYQEIAAAMGLVSANAARLLTGRALLDLGARMRARGIEP